MNPDANQPAPQVTVEQPTQPAPVAKKSKTGLIVGIVLGVVAVLAIVGALLWVFVFNKGVKYDTANLEEVTSGNARTLADSKWTDRTKSNLIGRIDFADSSRTNDGDPTNAVVALGSQSYGVRSVTDKQYELIIKSLGDKIDSDFSKTLTEDLCKDGSSKSDSKKDIKVDGFDGWVFEIDCVGRENGTPVKGLIRLVVAKDGKMYIHMVAASTDIWDNNTDYFKTVEESFSIKN